jgi:PIN domain nuclease of toxin-antitoxin system
MRRLLLDTHAFLWWVNDDPKLAPKAKRAIASAHNECYLSAASCWEMAIKASLGKLRLSKSVELFIIEQLAANGFTLLPIELRHAAQVERLPFHHRDPFDRLLIAQAITEKLTIVSADIHFSKYQMELLWR